MSKIKKGIKMRVNPEQSKRVQEICFENGIDWSSTKNTVRNTNHPFLFIGKDCLTYVDISQEVYFHKASYEEVSAELFIRTNGTCIESEATTENNNKGEQMEELKLECLVEGYEGTYFEVGQVWETRGKIKLKVKDFDFKTDIYKLTMAEVGDSTGEYYYTSKGDYEQGGESDLDLVRLISIEAPIESTPSEELQPKTLSEYLKENNAYESFVENCVNYFLNDIKVYYIRKSEDDFIMLDNTFNWRSTKEGGIYWHILHRNQPENLVYDMNEIIFAEVDKRIAEQKATTESTQSEFISTEEFEQMLEQKPLKRYMVFVEGKNTPRYIHETKDSAETEAKRLSTKLVGSKVFVVEIIKEYKSKVIVEEVK